MKRYELESLAKNFIIFFSLELALLVMLFMFDYRQELHNRLDKAEYDMKLCSYSLDCEKYDIDFVPKSNNLKTDILYLKDVPTIYFNMPTVQNYLLKISFNKNSYINLKKEIKSSLIKKFIIYAIIMAIISFVLSLYTLWPLKKALKLNDEFIKDILHDINTPLSSILINLKLLKREFGDNRKIERIESGIDTLLLMQNNLKSFLDSSKLQKEPIDIKTLIEERIEYFKHQYPKLKFISNLKKYKYNTNKDAFIRIVDNILSNASKYNKDGGFVRVDLKDNLLIIEDSGIGIKNTKKIFDRFYTENERGIGIGMHIVKKIADSLGIKIWIKSKVDKGTKVYLQLL